MYYITLALLNWFYDIYLFFTFYLFGPTISPIVDRILMDYFLALNIPSNVV